MTAALPLTIIGSGLVSPLGRDAPSSLAAIRAGMSGLCELPYADFNGERLIGARVPDEPIAGFADRLLGHLAQAVREAMLGGRLNDLSRIPVLLALPEKDRPGMPTSLSSHILPGLVRHLNLHDLDGRSQVYSLGHVAAFQAVAEARRLLGSRQSEACLVAGVDSFTRARTLLWLEQNGRLKVEREPVGIYPGEAAAALLMVPALPEQQPTLLRVLGLGFAREPVGPLDDAPLLGKGLATALREALAEAGLAMHEIAFRLSDVSGEPYGFVEQTLALARTMRVVRDSLPLYHPAEFLGDTGAAAGLCHLLIAAHAFSRRWAPGPYAACFTGSLAGERAVAIVGAGS